MDTVTLENRPTGHLPSRDSRDRRKWKPTTRNAFHFFIAQRASTDLGGRHRYYTRNIEQCLFELQDNSSLPTTIKAGLGKIASFLLLCTFDFSWLTWKKGHSFLCTKYSFLLEKVKRCVFQCFIFNPIERCSRDITCIVCMNWLSFDFCHFWWNAKMCFNQLRAFSMLVQCLRSGLTVTVRDSGIPAHYDVQKFCIGFSLPGTD